MDYQLIKSIHLLCVFFSFSYFLIRLRWSFLVSPMLDKRFVKISPHAIDTLLLSSAVGLVYMGKWSLIDEAWLLAKVIALICYIVFGSFALKRAKTKIVKVSCSVLSVLSFIYMLKTAGAKDPLWFLL